MICQVLIVQLIKRSHLLQRLQRVQRSLLQLILQIVQRSHRVLFQVQYQVICHRFHLSTLPSDLPSAYPSDFSSTSPSTLPSDLPSAQPSTLPSDLPSAYPSDAPSTIPSIFPSYGPGELSSKILYQVLNLLPCRVTCHQLHLAPYLVMLKIQLCNLLSVVSPRESLWNLARELLLHLQDGIVLCVSELRSVM